MCSPPSSSTCFARSYGETLVRSFILAEVRPIFCWGAAAYRNHQQGQSAAIGAVVSDCVAALLRAAAAATERNPLQHERWIHFPPGTGTGLGHRSLRFSPTPAG